MTAKLTVVSMDAQGTYARSSEWIKFHEHVWDSQERSLEENFDFRRSQLEAWQAVIQRDVDDRDSLVLIFPDQESLLSFKLAWS